MKRLIYIALVMLLPYVVSGQTVTEWPPGAPTGQYTWQPNATFGKDAQIQSANPKLNYGIRTNLLVRATGSGTNSVIRYDSLLTITVGSTTDSAFLYLVHLANRASNWPATDSLIVFLPLTRLFTEGVGDNAAGIVSFDSSSISSDNSGAADSAWSVAGGDYANADSAFFKLGSVTAMDTVKIDVTDLVTRALADPSGSFGWLIKANQAGTSPDPLLQVHSSDGATAGFLPRLVVFTTPTTITSILSNGVPLRVLDLPRVDKGKYILRKIGG